MRRLSFRPDGRERTRVLGGYLLWKELVSSDPEVSSARAALIERVDEEDAPVGRRQHSAAGGAIDDGLRLQGSAHRSDHGCSSRTTRPATAERTHSARLPNATRDPRPPGA